VGFRKERETPLGPKKCQGEESRAEVKKTKKSWEGPRCYRVRTGGKGKEMTRRMLLVSCRARPPKRWPGAFSQLHLSSQKGKGEKRESPKLKMDL